MRKTCVYMNNNNLRNTLFPLSHLQTLNRVLLLTVTKKIDTKKEVMKASLVRSEFVSWLLMNALATVDGWGNFSYESRNFEILKKDKKKTFQNKDKMSWINQTPNKSSNTSWHSISKMRIIWLWARTTVKPNNHDIIVVDIYMKQ